MSGPVFGSEKSIAGVSVRAVVTTAACAALAHVAAAQRRGAGGDMSARGCHAEAHGKRPFIRGVLAPVDAASSASRRSVTADDRERGFWKDAGRPDAISEDRQR